MTTKLVIWCQQLGKKPFPIFLLGNCDAFTIEIIITNHPTHDNFPLFEKIMGLLLFLQSFIKITSNINGENVNTEYMTNAGSFLCCFFLYHDLYPLPFGYESASSVTNYIIVFNPPSLYHILIKVGLLKNTYRNMTW